MFATAALDLVQVPPAGVPVSVWVVLTHIEEAPLMAAGDAKTVCVRVTKQPDNVLVKVMVVVPAATPVRTPEPVPMVATAVLEELQTPLPAPDEESVVLIPEQVDAVPVMLPGCG